MNETPLKRFFNLLRLDKRDISQIFFYAIFAGIISLSLPLGIQTIINFIQAGRISASWIVLVILVVIGGCFCWCFIFNATSNYRKPAAKDICSFLF